MVPGSSLPTPREPQTSFNCQPPQRNEEGTAFDVLRSKTAKNVILVEAAKMTDSLPMNAKRKAAFSKEAWQAMRARYTWYLRPPFDQEFARSHWWKNEPRIDPDPPRRTV